MKQSYGKKLKLRRLTISSVDEDMEQLEFSYTLTLSYNYLGWGNQRVLKIYYRTKATVT